MRTYSIPVIPTDLRHEESIQQTASALEHLCFIVNDVFDQIDNRISSNMQRIASLRTRVKDAQGKIESLEGINKAIVIYSPAKYPEDQLNLDIPKTFNKIETEARSFNLSFDIQSRLDDVNHRSIQEKLQLFHVKPLTVNDVTPERGMGSIPPDVDSLNGLFLFNTNEIIYDHGQTNLEKTEVKFQRRAARMKNNAIIEQSNTTFEIDAPPLDISRRHLSQKRYNDSYYYTPKKTDAPELNLPDDLPDLPGIADDIMYTRTEDENITPSVPFNVILPDLPDLIEEDEQKNTSTSISDGNISAVSNERTDTVTIVPPPPPPPKELLDKVPAPPPPPPPPMMLPAVSNTTSTPLDKSSKESEKPMQSIKSVTETDARMNLMAAIRNAGGTSRLKQASKTQEETKIEPPKSGGNDLMADLHRKLAMRRKGIAGPKDAAQEASSSGNVMNKVSAMIPPPPKRAPSSSNSDASDSGDWE